MRADFATRAVRAATVGMVFGVLAVAAAPATAEASGGEEGGAFLVAVATASGQLTATYAWTIAKAPDKASQLVPVGDSATVHWTITVGRSAAATLGATVSGKVCVANLGASATQGLAIAEQVSRPPATVALATATVDVSVRPVLAARTAFCYPYRVALPAAAIAPGATYRATARVTITNHAGHLGAPFGPAASRLAALPQSPTPVDAAITVHDTNGQTFSFGGSGSQGYDQSVACAAADGAHTIAVADTATIASTGQSATGAATIHCGASTAVTTTLTSSSIRTGGSVTDQAAIAGLPAGAGGTIAYTVYTDPACAGPVYADATPADNAISGVGVAASKPITFTTAGTYYWRAVYSGDSAHNALGGTSDCAGEKLTVTPGWQPGDLVTHNQVEWGDPASPAGVLLQSNFFSVYTAGFVEVGVPGPTGFSMVFTTSGGILDYLPSVGPADALNADLVDPTQTNSGAFGGEVLALRLNVDFADAGLTGGTSGLKFGDLRVCGLDGNAAALNGQTVREVLADANAALGGALTIVRIDDLGPITAQMNASFASGFVSDWAQAHLFSGTCP